MKKKIKGEKLTDAEIADAYIYPQVLNKNQQAEAKIQLAEARVRSRAKMTTENKLGLKLMQLRLQMEKYINAADFEIEKTFGYFLKEYLHLINVKRNVFAHDISIHETLLSQLINNKRSPNESIMIRLELHSNNTFPATVWHRIAEKEKSHTIETDKKLRQREKTKVKRRIAVAQ
jgi:plasmid maintenance system antidote protein VapI